MIKIYGHTPDNFDEIQSYVITDSAEAAREIINAEKCYFYDACSFRRHMELLQPEYVFAYIKKTKGIVIITRCILLELCSQNRKLWKAHIDYIRKLSEAGIKVLVIYEEDFFEALSLCFSEIAEVNHYLTWAVRVAKNKAGTVADALNADGKLRAEVISEKNPSDRGKFHKFFTKVRERKEPGDSLGEELIIICIHMLAGIPEIHEYKYVLFTEDKGAIAQFGKVFINLREHGKGRCAAAITSSKLAQLLWEEQILTDRENVKEILAAGNTGSTVKVLCSEKYDILPVLKTWKCGELAEKITSHGEIYINY